MGTVLKGVRWLCVLSIPCRSQHLCELVCLSQSDSRPKSVLTHLAWAVFHLQPMLWRSALVTWTFSVVRYFRRYWLWRLRHGTGPAPPLLSHSCMCPLPSLHNELLHTHTHTANTGRTTPSGSAVWAASSSPISTLSAANASPRHTYIPPPPPPRTPTLEPSESTLALSSPSLVALDRISLASCMPSPAMWIIRSRRVISDGCSGSV